MICPNCGSTISDDAQFCENCRETIKNEIDFPKETSFLGDNSDKDLSISLEGNFTTINAFPNKQKEIKIIVNNTTSNPIYDVEVTLSGPHQIAFIMSYKRFDAISANSSQSALFTIVTKGPGNFTLTVTLQSKDGHSQTYPIEVRSSILAETLASTKPPIKKIRQSELKNEWIGLLVILLVGITLLVGGIFSMFRTTQVGISLIILGLLCIGIGTKGRCAYCFLACGNCDC